MSVHYVQQGYIFYPIRRTWQGERNSAQKETGEKIQSSQKEKREKKGKQEKRGGKEEKGKKGKTSERTDSSKQKTGGKSNFPYRKKGRHYSLVSKFVHIDL